MRTRLKLAIVLGAACITGLPGQINENQVKAFFLYNFARYVEWPTLTPISGAVCRKLVSVPGFAHWTLCAVIKPVGSADM